jgi:hypothetical protein
MKFIVAFIIGMALGFWVNHSKVEAKKYNAKNRANVSTWNAMWLNLDDL